MKTVLLFCIVISIGAIECAKHEQPNHHEQNRIKSAASEVSSSLRTLLETTHSAKKQRKNIPNAATLTKLRASLASANQRLNGAYKSWQQTFLKNRKKPEFTQTLGKLSRAVLEQALAPIQSRSGVQTVYPIFQDGSVQTPEAQRFMAAIRELFAAMNDCIAAGVSPVQILKELMYQSNYDNKLRARKTGPYDFIEDNFQLVVSSLKEEKEDCDRRCNGIQDLIQVLGKHQGLDTEEETETPGDYR